MLRWLTGLLDAFDAAGVEVMPLKGPVLAERRHHPAFTRKPSTDLDIAVRPAHLDAANEVLRGLGYRLFAPVDVQRSYSHHIVHLHDELPRVELHFRLSHGARGIALDTFLDRAAPFELPGGRTVRVLEPGDELFHLVVHASHSRYAGLFHLHELRLVDQVLSRDERRWCAERASRHGFTRPLRITDAALRALWGHEFIPSGVSFPGTWLDWLSPTFVYRACARFVRVPVEHGLGQRLLGRSLDLLGADNPWDALRSGASGLKALVSQIQHPELLTNRDGGPRTRQGGPGSRREQPGRERRRGRTDRRPEPGHSLD